MDDYGTMDWEDWRQLAPQLRRRPTPTSGVMLVTLFGRRMQDEPVVGELRAPAAAQCAAAEDLRQRHWAAVQKELKAAPSRGCTKILAFPRRLLC